MWRFRRKRNPWGRIGGDVGKIINFIDTVAVDKLMEQGKDDDAFAARVFAIRLATMLANRSLVEEQVSKAEDYLESQRSVELAHLRLNGLSKKELENREHQLDTYGQVNRCFIQRAAAA